MKKLLCSLIFPVLIITSVASVSVNAQPVISGMAAGSATESSVIISWTTSEPASSQVNYGTTTAYGLSTLTDQALTTSHSMILNSLMPGTVYHYQVLSRNAAGVLETSPDATFSSDPLASASGSVASHQLKTYPSGKIVSWTPNPAYGYDSVMKLAWNYLLYSVPDDPLTGKPAYYSRSYLNPNSQTVVDWPHNPAGLFGMLIESALKYYAYSADTNVMRLATDIALWHLDHGMTLGTDNWAEVPYSSGDAGSTTYDGADKGNISGEGDGDGYLQPDKIGELGNAWLQLYKYSGNTRFRDAAIQAGDVLSSKIRVGTVNQSPWPFRVNAHTGAVREEYCSNIIAQITLLDNLIAGGFGNTATYQTTRTTAWNWLMTYPIQNNNWAQYFEDVGIQTPYNYNLNQYNAMMTARYLLEHPGYDADWETHVRGLITWVENTFGETSSGATIVKEQTPIFPFAMGSHTSRYASVNALLYENTGDLAAKEKAFRSFNWATYMARTNGVVIDGPLYGSFNNANQWFTDGYGDYIRHFMTGLGAVPEWSPADQTHLLRSSSVVKTISYGNNTLSYETYDPDATEVLHISYNPLVITADGLLLPQRADLSQPGWTLDIATKTLKIYHAGATHIVINPVATGPLPVTLGNFIATIDDNTVVLEWKTYSESNSKHFEIERSADGVNFEVIHTVTAAGNSNSTRYYSYRDRNLPQKTKLYYRLKQVDADEHYRYSQTLLLRFNKGSLYINKIYPTPASGAMHVDVTNVSEAANCTISLINLNGVTVKRSVMLLNKGDNIINIDTGTLPKGVYILKINNNKTEVVEKIIRE